MEPSTADVRVMASAVHVVRVRRTRNWSPDVGLFNMQKTSKSTAVRKKQVRYRRPPSRAPKKLSLGRRAREMLSNVAIECMSTYSHCTSTKSEKALSHA